MTVKCKLPYLTGTSKFFPRPLLEISKLTFHSDVQPAIVKEADASRVKPGEENDGELADSITHLHWMPAFTGV